MEWKVPASLFPEAEYTLRTLFGDWAGLEVSIVPWDSNDICVYRNGCRPIIFKNSFPAGMVSDWIFEFARKPPHLLRFQPSLPNFHHHLFSLGHHSFTKKLTLSFEDGQIVVDGIVLGLFFILLVQMEPSWNTQRDQFDLMPASSSFIKSEDYCHPVLNESFAALIDILKIDQNLLVEKKWSFRIELTSDIDFISSVQEGQPMFLFRNLASDLLKRRELNLLFRRSIGAFQYFLTGSLSQDPLNTFNFMMNLAERYNQRMIFFLKAGATSKKYDREYSLMLPFMQGILGEIVKRGHSVALHPSYETMNNAKKLAEEWRALNGAFHNLESGEVRLAARQHYLRMKYPFVWKSYEQLGIAEDYSTGFNEIVGFRSGTCFPYKAFDFEARRNLNVKVTPLILMESTLFDVQGLSWDEAETIFLQTSETVKKYGGVFSFVWHNSSLVSNRQRKFFEKIFSRLASGC